MDCKTCGKTIIETEVKRALKSGEVKTRDISLICKNSIEIPVQYWQAYNKVTSLAFPPDSKILASVSDTAIELWNVSGREPSLQQVKTFRDNEIIKSISFSNDGQKLVTLHSFDETIKLWDANDIKNEKATVSESGAYSVVFSPDDKTIVSGNYSGDIQIWEVEDAKLVVNVDKTIEAHTEAISCLKFSHDGRMLASRCIDGEVKVWNMSDNPPTLKFHVPRYGPKVFKNFVDFSEDDIYIIFDNSDAFVYMYDIETKQRITVKENKWEEGALREVRSLAFSPDDKLIVSAHIKKLRNTKLPTASMVDFWKWDKKELMWTIISPSPVTCVIFSPDEEYMAISHENSEIGLCKRNLNIKIF